MKIEFIVLLVIGVLLVIFLLKSSESYGQDASIRAAVGWIAGPKGMYGYDPIDEFARQIEEMRENEMRNGTHPSSPRYRSVGQSSPEMRLMTGKPNLVDSPDHSLGPEYYSKGLSAPLNLRKCNSSRDCLDGEECQVGNCVPANSEGYVANAEKQCMSCMSTEEFERLS